MFLRCKKRRRLRPHSEDPSPGAMTPAHSPKPSHPPTCSLLSVLGSAQKHRPNRLEWNVQDHSSGNGALLEGSRPLPMVSTKSPQSPLYRGWAGMLNLGSSPAQHSCPSPIGRSLVPLSHGFDLRGNGERGVQGPWVVGLVVE